ncbi:MAG: T9SS type A sorting domain-containing protein, partial [Saprospiraceae bacterium]|nr:T9SS type A sorting domain-containing protein [Saprospiraceae bacterium]
CLPNHVGYSSEFQLCVNMGGALGDTSWVDASDPPMISYHVPTDPFAPYEEDILIVPTTGELVVEVQGSYLAQQKANALGLNASFSGQNFTDVYSVAADSRNDGLEGLFPMPRPNWDLSDDGVDNPVAVEASPWEFWDETFWSTPPFGQATLTDPGGPCEGIPIEFCNWNIIQKMSNPDMSFAKATAYQDSILGYFAPRAYLALDLANLSDTEDILDQNFVEISPNPSASTMFIKSFDKVIKAVEVIDMQGRVVKADRNINNNFHSLNKEDIGQGMFVVNVRFDEGIVTKKVVFN